MNFAWLKRYMPRGLYGRALLILVLPVVTVQLVVSVVFIQRHFEGVTRQMTLGTIAELEYLIDQVNLAPDLDTAKRAADSLSQRLDLNATLPVQLHDADRRHLYDLSGRIVIKTLHDRIDPIQAIDLIENYREVRMDAVTDHGAMLIVLPRQRVSASNPHQLLVLMIFTSFLMTLIAYLFLRNQLRPIKRLADASEAFGKGRHVKYKPAGAREVRSAGQAFLDMRNRIERQIEQRTLMLSGVSHDLRTPLTRMKLALSMQDETDDTADMMKDVEDMQRLVDEFLSFARGDALEEAIPTDAAALAAEVVEMATRAGQDVSLGHVAEAGEAMLRPQALTRALENLIGNAVRYGTKARVSVETTPRTIKFLVEDDGPGIDDALVDQAVKPFARLDPSRNQNKSSGVGLGLSIATDIARSHGGSLTLRRSADLGGLSAELLIMR
ncbi:ATP-binding protein [Qingshengfaniella alkalisoli]|uniref:histidine kinase n=1 Tax=Qingshengfaniella alkalisoli TaxID=2599296 RepID=A0A5B8I900_9RHOB|nr:ATP-binding protein [Qingshengfaniella alkalisoli]QDY69326.1 HAMP domain-containing protein [Qingshengfaniella alkalisoli]